MKRNIPTLIYVNKMDNGNPDFDELMDDIRLNLGETCVPFTFPLGHNEDFDGFVNVISLKARKFNGTECVDDEIYEDVKRFVIKTGKCSTSKLINQFGIGYSKAARYIDMLEEEGIVGPENGSKPREVLVFSEDDLDNE